jgi:hypothetical protein
MSLKQRVVKLERQRSGVWSIALLWMDEDGREHREGDPEIASLVLNLTGKPL